MIAQEVFEIADKLEKKLLALHDPIFVRDFIFYSSNGVTNEAANKIVDDTLEEISFNNWDESLCKLLGKSISATEKQNTFKELAKKISEFEKKNDSNILKEVVINTKLGSAIWVAHELECKKYIRMMTDLVSKYKEMFLKYSESLVVSDIISGSKEKRSKKESEDYKSLQIKEQYNIYSDNSLQECLIILRKKGFVLKETTLPMFKEAFSGEVRVKKIIWIGSPVELKDFIDKITPCLSDTKNKRIRTGNSFEYRDKIPVTSAGQRSPNQKINPDREILLDSAILKLNPKQFDKMR
jgi:hypothetical protein